jgi:protein SCO1/2
VIEPPEGWEGEPDQQPEPQGLSMAARWRLRVLALVLLLFVVMIAAGVRLPRLPSFLPRQPPPVLGQVPPFALTNRDGRPVTLASLAGRPWIADFVFTRCAASCPMMTARLARLGKDLPAGEPIHRVSFTVDSAHDTPEVLARYADSFQAPPDWFFLTGPEADLQRLSRQGFKLALDVPQGAPGSTVEPILHSTRFVLVDGQGRIRGYYDGQDEEAMRRLVRDLRAVAS